MSDERMMQINGDDELPPEIRALVELTKALDDGITSLLKAHHEQGGASPMMLTTASLAAFGAILGRMAVAPGSDRLWDMDPEVRMQEMIDMVAANLRATYHHHQPKN